MPIVDAEIELSCAGANETFSGPDTEKHYPPDLELEPLHIDIDLHVDLENEAASGTVIATVKARRDGVRQLSLDALDFEDLEVWDVDDRDLNHRYDGRSIMISWKDPFAQSEERRVAVCYRVIRPVSGLFFSKPTDAYPDDSWYAATDHETERAKYWLPCIDLPNVRTTLDFHLRADQRFTILANGSLIDEIVHDDGTKTAHWRLAHRCPSYLACFAIGEFMRVDDEPVGDIPIAYFTVRDFNDEDLRRSFGRTRDMLLWMIDKLGMPYPFPKYLQFALPCFYGAMENISLVSWNDIFILDEILAKEWQQLVDAVNVHEMAHSYFGDAVVCRDFAHAWLKESWATYMEQCWLEDTCGEDDALYEFYRNAVAYFTEASERYQRPIVTRQFRSSRDMYDKHLYPGGACRLHMLRLVLGDEVFWGAVSDYLRRYTGKVVETDDFRRVLEEHSGRSLGRWFDQWFFTPGYPLLNVRFKYDEASMHGTFEIEQKQVDRDKGIPPFVIETELGWTVDGQDYSQPVTLEHPKHTFVVDIANAPTQVRFDPKIRVLAKLDFNPGDTLLRHQLTEAKDVVGRILAATELAKTGKHGNVQAIVNAYSSEAFWGVRVEMAKALGRVSVEAALQGLLQIIAIENDPRVLETVFHAAAKYRDPRIKDALLTRLEVDLPYRGQMAAYEALGAQRVDAPWELLVEAAAKEDFSGFVQGGAFRGLAATRRTEAVEILLERVGYGTTRHRARPAAVAALAELGSMQEPGRREQVVDALVALLRDPVEKVRRAAAEGL
ncbi:MAG: M1 family metallopeptidase, partial [Gammaproteobacteria bacterium]|nr:M1 family metallopeptidase [Gammaproteobacteria bacterium]